jgi:hypothetical protein
MASSLHGKISLAAIKYIINHVFLPPKLPQADDFNSTYESTLVKIIIDAFLEFKTHLSGAEVPIIDRVLQMMHRLQSVHISTSVSEAKLAEALASLSNEGKAPQK